jgi:hypothetical protein
MKKGGPWAAPFPTVEAVEWIHGHGIGLVKSPRHPPSGGFHAQRLTQCI